MSDATLTVATETASTGEVAKSNARRGRPKGSRNRGKKKAKAAAKVVKAKRSSNTMIEKGLKAYLKKAEAFYLSRVKAVIADPEATSFVATEPPQDSLPAISE